MFLVDESVDNGITVYLRDYFSEHHDGDTSIIDIRSIQVGLPDIDILKVAYTQQLICITEDKDFGELAYRLAYPHCGIVLIRIKDLPRNERIRLAASTIFQYKEELKNNFSVITKNGIKIKKRNSNI